MALTYSSYLKLEDLLRLQQRKSESEHDEMLFIVIHQVYELWFKQVLHELDRLRACFLEGNTHGSLATLKRVLTIFKTLVSQVDILETMTPLSFNTFRDRLESSSGFQSFQFREFECLLGIKRPHVLNQYAEGSPERAKIEKRMKEPSLFDAFLKYLDGQGYGSPSGDDAIQDMLVKVYKDDELVSQVCERLVDLDEGVQEWRYRHVKMVERTIGNKQGTGGSLGVEYLKKTLFQPAFPDLWAIRSRL